LAGVVFAAARLNPRRRLGLSAGAKAEKKIADPHRPNAFAVTSRKGKFDVAQESQTNVWKW
jgi:hypothetical protein